MTRNWTVEEFVLLKRSNQVDQGPNLALQGGTILQKQLQILAILDTAYVSAARTHVSTARKVELSNKFPAAEATYV